MKTLVLASVTLAATQIASAQTSIALTSPSSNATYSSPAAVAVSATVSGSAAIDFVDFFANGKRIGTDSSAPYSATWSGAGGGNYQITAVAVDSGGNQFKSAPVDIDISGTGVTLAAPLDGSVFATGDIQLQATTSGAAGAITKVEFYNGAQLLSTITAAPYSYTWQAVPPGTNYRVTAKAYDSGGAVLTSFGASIMVTPPPGATVIRDTAYPIPNDGTAYFVATNGNNSWSGQLTVPNAANTDGPFASLSRALSAAPAGSTVVIRGGVYAADALSLTKKLTLQPYPHEQVWISGSVAIPASDWVPDGTAWRKDGWTYEFPRVSTTGLYSSPCPACIDTAYPEADYRDQVFMDGVPRKQVLRRQDVVAGTFYVDNAADQIFVGDNPAGRSVEATAYRYALVFPRSTPASAGSIIRGLGFRYYPELAMYVETSRVLIENNAFVWNGSRGLNLNGSGTGDWGDDLRVVGNTFSFNGRKGVGGNDTDRMLFEGNVVSFNNTEFFRLAWDAAGAKFTRCDDAVFRNNAFENNNSTGLWLDVSVTDAKLVSNIARSNRSIGMQFEVSSRAIIASNLAVENGQGIQVSGSSSAQIYNNTLVNNTENIQVKDTSRVNTNQAEIAAGVDWETRDVTIKNNILSNAKSPDQMLNIFDSACGATGPPCIANVNIIAGLDFNSYYRTDSGQPRNLIRWYPIGVGPDRSFATLTAFRSATGLEGNGAESTGSSNPFFLDEVRGDYRLQSNSEARNSGTPLPDDVAAAIGVTPGVPVDRGSLTLQNPLAATSDSYVRDGTYAGLNYGNESTLEIKTSTQGFNRDAYLRFDLTSINTVTHAKLRVYAALTAGTSSGTRVALAVYPVSDGWDESSVTWTNRPAMPAFRPSIYR